MIKRTMICRFVAGLELLRVISEERCRLACIPMNRHSKNQRQHELSVMSRLPSNRRKHHIAVRSVMAQY